MRRILKINANLLTLGFPMVQNEHAQHLHEQQRLACAMVQKILQGQTGKGSVKPETLFEMAEKTVCGQHTQGPETRTDPVGIRLRYRRLDNA